MSFPELTTLVHNTRFHIKINVMGEGKMSIYFVKKLTIITWEKQLLRGVACKLFYDVYNTKW